MTKKITQEEYIKRCIEKHGIEKYDYSNTVYKSAKTKVEIYCKTCSKIFYQAAFEHSNTGQGCPTCGIKKRNDTQRMTKEEFVKRACAANGNSAYDYSGSIYVSFHTKLKIFCNKHAHTFYQSPSNHLASKSGCKFCESEKIADSNKDSVEEFTEKARNVFGERFDYSLVEYKNSATKVAIKCKQHNHVFYQAPGLHLSGRIGCLLCQQELESPLKQDTAYFISKAEEIHGIGLFDYSGAEYKGSSEKVKIGCKKHNIVFQQTASNHYNSALGCPQCFAEHKISGHPLKITNEDFISRSRKLFGNFYDYSLVDLSGSRENRKVTLICPDHGVFEQDIFSHLSGAKAACCVNRNRTTESFIKEVVDIYGDIFDFSETEYNGSNTVITLGCKEHGRFYPTPGSLLQGHSCPSCADYGFNPNKPAVLYIHSAISKYHEFTGFGITRNLKSRTRSHTKNLTREGYLIAESFVSDEMDGKYIQQLERVLKETFPPDANTSHLVGFKTESTTASFHDVCQFVQNYINNNKEPHGDDRLN